MAFTCHHTSMNSQALQKLKSHNLNSQYYSSKEYSLSSIKGSVNQIQLKQVLKKGICRTIYKAIDMVWVWFLKDLNSISRTSRVCFYPHAMSERENVNTTIKATYAILTISLWIISPISINMKKLFQYCPLIIIISLIIVESLTQSHKWKGSIYYFISLEIILM